jgi:hypothetical protein
MSFRCEDIANYDSQSISFGVDKMKVAAQLRKLADEVEKPLPFDDPEAEYILLQGVETKYTVEHDDFAMTTITLKFATKKVKNAGIKE